MALFIKPWRRREPDRSQLGDGHRLFLARRFLGPETLHTGWIRPRKVDDVAGPRWPVSRILVGIVAVIESRCPALRVHFIGILAVPLTRLLAVPFLPAVLTETPSHTRNRAVTACARSHADTLA